MVPLVVQGDTIGLLEVVDQKRSRQYSRQELRLAGAIAGQAAVAIKNAKLFAERRRSDEDVASLRRVPSPTHRARARRGAGGRRPDVPRRRGRRRLRRASAPSRASPAWAARAPAPSAPARSPPPSAANAERGANANLVVSRDPSGRTDLTLAVTLSEPPGEGQVELLDFIAAATAAVTTAGSAAATSEVSTAAAQTRKTRASNAGFPTLNHAHLLGVLTVSAGGNFATRPPRNFAAC